MGVSFYMYIIHKPIDFSIDFSYFSIDFSYRLKTNPNPRILGHMAIGFKQERVSSGNLLPSLSTENHLLSLTELADRK